MCGSTGGVGLHFEPVLMVGGSGLGHSTGAGVHFTTTGGGTGVGVGRLHLMVFCVGICWVTGLQSIGVGGVKVLFCEQSAWGVSAALPTLNLKQVSAERMLLRTKKERMNFIC